MMRVSRANATSQGGPARTVKDVLVLIFSSLLLLQCKELYQGCFGTHILDFTFLIF